MADVTESATAPGEPAVAVAIVTGPLGVLAARRRDGELELGCPACGRSRLTLVTLTPASLSDAATSSASTSSAIRYPTSLIS
jgi:hypothetical protein